MKIDVRQTQPLPDLHPRHESESASSIARTVNGLGRFLVMGGAGAARMALDPKTAFSNPLKRSGLSGGGFTELQDLLRTQHTLQRQMQDFTMKSNIRRTEHESRMAAVRNMRA